MAELLAPAGSFEALRAAVEAGADAIYLAGKMFGARAYAANFDDEEMARAVRYAHLHRVRIYVAVNTLVDEREIPAALDYIHGLNEIGVDALIMQDLGLASLVRERFPELHLHASTQMTVHNKEGVEFLARHGFTRVVVSREMALADIKEICQTTGMEIEVFVHGALCVCYSGQCLMSSMIGGRSGNRGRCAQPCRLPYQLQDKNGRNVLEQHGAGTYLLSPKDLNSLHLLPLLEEAGVASLKIEGRMKKPEYVAIVVESYRSVLEKPELLADSAARRELERRLAQIFNRDFTSAYLAGEKPTADFLSHQRPNNRGIKVGRISQYDHAKKRIRIKLDEPVAQGDILDVWVSVGGRVSLTLDEIVCGGRSVTEAPAQSEIELTVPQPVRLNDRVFKVFDQKLMQHARDLFEQERNQKRIALTAVVSIEEGKPAQLQLVDRDGNCGSAQTDFITEKAIKRALTEEVVMQQLNRMGATCFQIETLQASIQDGVMVPVSELNELRRRAVQSLEEARLRSFENRSQQVDVARSAVPGRGAQLNKRLRVAVWVSGLDDLTIAVAEGADRILFGGENFAHRALTRSELEQAVAYCRQRKCQIVLATPKIIAPQNWPQVCRELEWADELCVDGVLVANIGLLERLRKTTKLTWFADQPLSIYNAQTARFFQQEGCLGLCMSPELNFAQLTTINRMLPPALELECIVHGNLELMTSEYCVDGAFGGCSVCDGTVHYLEDRKQERFPVVRDQYCRMHILNAKTLDMLEHVARFKEIGVDWLRIDGRYSEAGLSGLVKKYVKAAARPDGDGPIAEQGGNNTITRGHYFRGVL